MNGREMRNSSTGLRGDNPLGAWTRNGVNRQTPTPSVPSASGMGILSPRETVAVALHGQPGGWGHGHPPFPLSPPGAPCALAVGSFRSPSLPGLLLAASQLRLLQGRSEMVDLVPGVPGGGEPLASRQHCCFPGLFRTALMEQGGSLSIYLHVLNTSHPCFWFTSQEDGSDDLNASQVLSPDAPSHSGIREQLGQACPASRLLPFAPGAPLTFRETRGLGSRPCTLLALDNYHLRARHMIHMFSMDSVIPTVMRKLVRSSASPA